MRGSDCWGPVAGGCCESAPDAWSRSWLHERLGLYGDYRVPVACESAPEGVVASCRAVTRNRRSAKVGRITGSTGKSVAT